MTVQGALGYVVHVKLHPLLAALTTRLQGKIPDVMAWRHLASVIECELVEPEIILIEVRSMGARILRSAAAEAEQSGHLAYAQELREASDSIEPERRSAQ